MLRTGREVCRAQYATSSSSDISLTSDLLLSVEPGPTAPPGSTAAPRQNATSYRLITRLSVLQPACRPLALSSKSLNASQMRCETNASRLKTRARNSLDSCASLTQFTHSIIIVLGESVLSVQKTPREFTHPLRSLRSSC